MRGREKGRPLPLTNSRHRNDSLQCTCNSGARPKRGWGGRRVRQATQARKNTRGNVRLQAQGYARVLWRTAPPLHCSAPGPVCSSWPRTHRCRASSGTLQDSRRERGRRWGWRSSNSLVGSRGIWHDSHDACSVQSTCPRTVCDYTQLEALGVSLARTRRRYRGVARGGALANGESTTWVLHARVPQAISSTR